jgi:hypothetical protein
MSADGFEHYDTWRCSPPSDEHPDPPDPHEACERLAEDQQAEIAQLHNHIDELETQMAHESAPMTYAELFAAVAQRVAHTIAIGVQSWRHVDVDGEVAIRTRWSIYWFAGTPETCKAAHGDTAEAALAALDAALCAPLDGPVTDATGIGHLVGAAEVAP